MLNINGSPYKHAIFDVDGVLNQLFPYLTHYCMEAARMCNLPTEIIELDFARIRKGELPESGNIWDGARSHFPDASDDEIRRFVSVFLEIEDARSYPPVTKSVEFIRELVRRKILVSLCTTNTTDMLVRKLRSMGLDTALFSGLSTWDAEHRKPHPGALASLAALAEREPEYTLFVGDSTTDYLTAESAGIMFFAVTQYGITPRSEFERLGVPPEFIFNEASDLSLFLS